MYCSSRLRQLRERGRVIVHYVIIRQLLHSVFNKRGLSKKYPAIFFPAVSNGEWVGKLGVVVEGTFMRMRDFLLPRSTAGCVCRCQIAKWWNTYLSLLISLKMTERLEQRYCTKFCQKLGETQAETIRTIQHALRLLFARQREIRSYVMSGFLPVVSLPGFYFCSLATVQLFLDVGPCS
jgi:hypothetical protein